MSGDLAIETVAGLLADLADRGRIAGEVRVSGAVTMVDVRVNRAEREWAVLTVDDGTGRIDVLAFPKTWPSIKPVATQGTTAILTGLLDHDAKTGQLRIFATGRSPAP